VSSEQLPVIDPKSKIQNPKSLKQQVQRLHRVRICSRWFAVAAIWMSFGIYGIWGLRQEIALWQQHFTWVAVRYALAYNQVPALCLFFCLGVTAAVSVWQSQRALLGISLRERQRLEKQVQKIQATGPRHPLWKWVIGS
jgi:hypothetical protein